MTNFRTTAGPAAEPVSLSFVRNYLKLDDNAEDDQIILLGMAAARRWAEDYTGRALMSQTIEQVWDGWPCGMVLDLARCPPTAVTSVQYRDSDGDYQTWAADNYTLDEISEPARIVRKPNTSWPAHGQYPNAVKATYTAGCATAEEVPDGIKQAMLLLVAFWYDNREDIPIGETNNPRLRSARWLLNQYKIDVL